METNHCISYLLTSGNFETNSYKFTNIRSQETTQLLVSHLFWSAWINLVHRYGYRIHVAKKEKLIIYNFSDKIMN